MASQATKRTMNEQQTVDTFEKILDAMGSSDMRYILKELQEGPPALVPYLASLIRDRVLHRAIEKNTRDVAPARLGKKLPEKVLRFRGLPIAIKQDFIDMCTAEKLFWEETEISPAITLTSDQLNELMEYQLHQSSWSLLPQTHRGARYSGPLLEVLRLRGVEKGNRLSTLTKDQYRDGLWGYVREVAPDWTWLKTHDGQELKDFLPRSVYKKATDWVLENNYSTKVAVISESFGYAQSVSKLLKTAGLKPFDAEPDDNSFEMPNACNSFPMPPAEQKVCKPKAGPVQPARSKYKKKAVVPPPATGRPMPAQARPKKRAAPPS